ncbi:MAG: response regulator [Candidatus Binatia bacterium]
MADESILIVDDQPIHIKLIEVVLTGEGYHLAVAANATEALEAVQKSTPDLILLDIHLPGMGGLELARLLKSTSVSRYIKIVAMSAYTSGEDEDRIIAAGCDGYITKPIDSRTFPQSIREYLNK